MKKLLLAGAFLAIGISTAAAQRPPVVSRVCASKACVYRVFATGQQGSCSGSTLRSQPVGAPCACPVKIQSPALGTPGVVPFQGVVSCRTAVRRR